MKIFVSIDGDHIGRMIGRMALADKVEEVRKLSQSIDRGNEIWRSWAMAQGGNVINAGGDECRLEVESDHLQDLPRLREQYKSAVGATVSVGVGLKMSEADKALLAAKTRGGDQIQLYTEEVEDILSELEEQTEGAKIEEEYLDPSTGLQKDEPKQDYEQLFHQAASQPKQEEPSQAPQNPDAHQKLREGVVQILQQVKAHAPELEEMKAQNPELYKSVTALVQAMITMARETFASGPGQESAESVQKSVQKSEKDRKTGKYVDSKLDKPCTCGHKLSDHTAAKVGEERPCLAEGCECNLFAHDKNMEKAALDPGKTGRHQVVLPVGSQIDSGPGNYEHGGKIKVQKPDGTTTWRQVRANMVQADDGTPTSSRNPHPQ